ncbi:Carbohydrate sulfotransferase 11 [Fukomys damarensis]|uniref:Carbohydrate sulfotransferase 11 n=1 Tax=Fukomys damarensis TaxID=885580 RepID=A0A091E5C0_FUKDA|nr:Carbohydrate sulfotransferase 11 [Fukomys damarensis]
MQCGYVRSCLTTAVGKCNASQVMRRNPFGVDICCRKGSRSPLQELYNPIQKAQGERPPTAALPAALGLRSTTCSSGQLPFVHLAAVRSAASALLGGSRIPSCSCV